MRRARGVLPYLALGFIVALFAGSALFSFARIEQQSDELVVQKNSLLLLALSLETEYLRLITSFTRYRLDPTELHRADAEHRLDLTWSRLPVLLEGREGAPLRRLDQFDEVIDQTRCGARSR